MNLHLVPSPVALSRSQRPRFVQFPENQIHAGSPLSLFNHARYDVFGHLTQVRMDRTIGGTVRTQYRNWVYDPGTLRLTSKTSPESGTVTYSYNSDGTLATVTDAKNQRRVYSYDNYGRITQIARGTMSGTTFTENVAQRTNYAYSGTNGGYSTATAGRVSSITYKGPHGLAFNEIYSYVDAGGISKKRVSMTGTPFGSSTVNLDAGYSFDGEGNIQTIQYPNSETDSNGGTVGGALFTYEYDSMERLNKMTDPANLWVSSVTYGPSNEVQQMVAGTFTENRNYNANLDLIELTSGSNLHYKYNYSTTQDNGQIQSQQDVLSGETITYQYDTLKRLIQASATGDSHGSWSQAMSYDGFGNLTQKNSNNAPGLSIAVDYNTNRIQTNAGYDTNGNMTGYAGTVYGYDIDNRLVSANNSIAYGYDSTNHRVYKAAVSGSTYSAEEIYFYGTEGHKYGTWKINPSTGVLLKASVTKQWFGNRLVSPQDGIDSRGKYFTYGEERTNVSPANPPNDQEKYASYTRDSATGLDYANQRYYSSLIGRFMSPDPLQASARMRAPQSWNRYAYVESDPINDLDPTGMSEYNGGWYDGGYDGEFGGYYSGGGGGGYGDGGGGCYGSCTVNPNGTATDTQTGAPIIDPTDPYASVPPQRIFDPNAGPTIGPAPPDPSIPQAPPAEIISSIITFGVPGYTPGYYPTDNPDTYDRPIDDWGQAVVQNLHNDLYSNSNWGCFGTGMASFYTSGVGLTSLAMEVPGVGWGLTAAGLVMGGVNLLFCPQ